MVWVSFDGTELLFWCLFSCFIVIFTTEMSKLNSSQPLQIQTVWNKPDREGIIKWTNTCGLMNETDPEDRQSGESSSSSSSKHGQMKVCVVMVISSAQHLFFDAGRVNITDETLQRFQTAAQKRRLTPALSGHTGASLRRVRVMTPAGVWTEVRGLLIIVRLVIRRGHDAVPRRHQEVPGGRTVERGGTTRSVGRRCGSDGDADLWRAADDSSVHLREVTLRSVLPEIKTVHVPRSLGHVCALSGQHGPRVHPAGPSRTSNSGTRIWAGRSRGRRERRTAVRRTARVMNGAVDRPVRSGRYVTWFLSVSVAGGHVRGYGHLNGGEFASSALRAVQQTFDRSLSLHDSQQAPMSGGGRPWVRTEALTAGVQTVDGSVDLFVLWDSDVAREDLDG